MKENGLNNEVADWLKNLERESWHLELLLSGFSIFLLVQGRMALNEYGYIFIHSDSASSGFLPGLAEMVTFIVLLISSKSIDLFIIFLLAHLLTRGFWIGALGLRSVQNKLEVEELGYNAFFTEKLKQRTISLDQLIVRLDLVCSAIFAFTFLVISMLVSFVIYLIPLAIVSSIFEEDPVWLGWYIEIPLYIFLALYLITGFIYFIDYVTLGFFKSWNWIKRFYYPIYRFYSFLTLSFISRSIYYSLINRFSKKGVWGIYGALVLIYLATHPYFYKTFDIYPEDDYDLTITSAHYQDERSPDRFVRRISIPSRYINEPHFELFIVYSMDDDERIQRQCPGVEPRHRKEFRMLTWNFKGTIGNMISYGSGVEGYDIEEIETLASCMGSIYEIRVNGCLYEELDYYFYKYPTTKQKGLLVPMSTKDFLDGANVLEVRKMSEDSTEGFEPYVRTLFWYKREN